MTAVFFPHCHARNDVTEGKIANPSRPGPPPHPPKLSNLGGRGRDLEQSSQASGEVKEARVIAVTYLGGKNVCSRSLCTLPL